MKLRSSVVIAATVAAALVSGAPARAEDEKASVALPILSVTFTPVYVAKDMGFWAKEGLDVSLHDISGLGSTNAMLAGSIDFAVQSGLSFIRGNMRGQKMLGIELMANGVAFEITGRKALLGNITMATPVAERAKWLKGKKVAVDAPNTIVHAFLRYIAKKGGVDAEKEITVTPMQPENELAAMKSGAIDAGTWTFPWTFASQRQGDVLIASGLSDVPELLPFGSTDTATRPDFCEKKPSVCMKLGRGYVAAHAFIQDHPAEALEIVRKRMPQIHADDLKGAFDQMRKTTPRSPAFSEEGLAHAQELMLIGGMIKPDEKLSSFTALYTNKFIQ
jgi:NitT/TauT family transport system substrate-binding protein